MKLFSRNILALLLILGAILCGFAGIQYPGLGYGDEAYQLLCIDNYQESPPGMLSYYIADGWEKIWGDSVIAMRVLASLCTIASVGVGCLYLYRRTGNVLMSAVIFCCCVMTARISDFNFYNWETGSFFFAAVSLLLMLSLLRTERLWKYMALGGMLALTALAKVTMVVEIVPALMIVIHNGRGKIGRIMTSMGLGLTGFLGVVTVMTCLMCGGVGDYIAALRPENITSGHTPGDISRYVDRFVDQMPFQLASWTPAILSFPIAAMMPRLANFWKAIVLAGLTLLSAATLWLIGNLSDYEYPLLGCAFPLLVYVIFFVPLWNSLSYPSRRLPKNRFPVWIILVFVVLIGFGSDSIYERCTVIFALPMALGEIWDNLSGRARQLLSRMLALGFMSLAVMWGCRIAMQVRLCVYEGAPYPRCQHLMLNQRINNQLEEIAPVIARCKAEGLDYVVIGDRYPALAIYGYDNGLSIHQFSQLLHEGPEGIERLRQTVCGRDAVLLVVGRGEECAEVEDMLTEEDFRNAMRGVHLRFYSKTGTPLPDNFTGWEDTSCTQVISQRFDSRFKSNLRLFLIIMDTMLLSGIILVYLWSRRRKNMEAGWS